LSEFISESLGDGSVALFEPYEAVHRGNLAKVLAVTHAATS
jgi:hypothetical protein